MKKDLLPDGGFMVKNKKGILLIIGGAEDKENKRTILKKFVELAGKKEAKVVIMTAATEEPIEVGNTYYDIFKKLSVEHISILNISTRKEANHIQHLDTIKEATGVFFTGGDQLRITSILGGTMVDGALHEAFEKGLVIAGTSAGASVMSATMIVEGDSEESPKKNTLKMAPGMDFISEVVVDQHFAQRGRIGRLLTAVAQNPYILGVGIDEDTAIIVDDGIFEVCGSQTVTIVDGRKIESTNVSISLPNEPLALVNVTLHVLPTGYKFDLNKRIPLES
jgi:cyanophycinase